MKSVERACKFIKLTRLYAQPAMGNSSTAGSHCRTSSQASDSIPFPAQPQRLTGGLKTTVCAPKLSLLAFDATSLSSYSFFNISCVSFVVFSISCFLVSSDSSLRTFSYSILWKVFFCSLIIFFLYSISDFFSSISFLSNSSRAFFSVSVVSVVLFFCCSRFFCYSRRCLPKWHA